MEAARALTFRHTARQDSEHNFGGHLLRSGSDTRVRRRISTADLTMKDRALARLQEPDTTSVVTVRPIRGSVPEDSLIMESPPGESAASCKAAQDSHALRCT